MACLFTLLLTPGSFLSRRFIPPPPFPGPFFLSLSSLSPPFPFFHFLAAQTSPFFPVPFRTFGSNLYHASFLGMDRD